MLQISSLCTKLYLIGTSPAVLQQCLIHRHIQPLSFQLAYLWDARRAPRSEEVLKDDLTIWSTVTWSFSSAPLTSVSNTTPKISPQGKTDWMPTKSIDLLFWEDKLKPSYGVTFMEKFPCWWGRGVGGLDWPQKVKMFELCHHNVSPNYIPFFIYVSWDGAV